MDGNGLAVEVELKTVKQAKVNAGTLAKLLTPRQVKKLLLYIFVQPGFYMDRLVRHHEAFAEVGPRTGAHLAGCILDFTDDEAGGVPVSIRMNTNKERTESRRQKGPHSDASSLLLNLLIRVAPVQGQVGFDLKVHTTRLERK